MPQAESLNSWDSVSKAVPKMAVHPLSPLSAAEISRSSDLMRSVLPGNPDVQFKAICLEEPEKAVMVPYLDAEHAGKTLPSPIDRRVFISYYIRNTDKLHEAIVNLSKGEVESNVRVGAEHHAPADAGEILAVEKKVFESEKVQAELRTLNLPPETKFICDPWIYGSDGNKDEKRMFQTYIYMRDPNNCDYADSNHYAYPLPISPVLDGHTLELIRIDRIPTGKGLETKPMSKPTKIHPPCEYTPECQKLRTDLKPLHVVQPEGASFSATKVGETMENIEWQKWSFRLGFNQREGIVLYDIRYDNRSLFYRMSLSDMSIPYADPRPPLHRKEAFDLGDVGAGIMANNLKLGCDCLGSIHYMSGVVLDDTGNPDPRPNAICIHEQDNGILWKHTNYRTERAAVVRRRELVVQSIITVANYEYLLSFIFNQAGELAYEVRATGIVSTQPIDEGLSVPWGTVVHPGVLASHHQHIFSLRVDPAIDGHENALVSSEIHPIPIDETFNPHGHGYMVRDSVVRETGGLDLDETTNRTFKITNPHTRNPINGKAVAYKVQPPQFQKIVAHPNSYHAKRAEFGDHNVYVTKYKDGELYAGGKYTNQSRGGHGVRGWASRKEDITGGSKAANGTTNGVNGTNGLNGPHGNANGIFEGANPELDVQGSDIVLWIQFGLQHVVRTEDWPVMPAEMLSIKFKPVNFFDKNPAIDVPPSEQAVNKSVELGAHTNGTNGHAAESHMQGGIEGTINGVVNGNGHCH